MNIKFNPLSIIGKPVAIYIVALELNASFWMLLLAYVLFTVSLEITWRK